MAALVSEIVLFKGQTSILKRNKGLSPHFGSEALSVRPTFCFGIKACPFAAFISHVAGSRAQREFKVIRLAGFQEKTENDNNSKSTAGNRFRV